MKRWTEPVVAYKRRAEITLPLLETLANIYGRPPIGQLGRPVDPRYLPRQWERYAAAASSALSVPVTPDVPPSVAQPFWMILLSKWSQKEYFIGYGEDDPPFALHLDVLERAEPPLATLHGDSDASVSTASGFHRFLTTSTAIAPILDASYAVGGDIHDFVDPDLQRPLDKPWPVLYFCNERATKLDLSHLPPSSRVERRPEGIWILTGANPFGPSPERDKAVRALGEALGFPLES